MNILELMRQRTVDAMIADARFLEKQQPSRERSEAIERQNRHVMIEYALGHITKDERDRIH